MSLKRAREDDDDPAVASEAASRLSKPRLTRACAECKKHKIRCETRPGEASCVKCLRSGIECVPFNFAQKYMDEDAEWKAVASATQDQLTAAVQYLLRHNQLPDLSAFVDGQAPTPVGPSTSRSAMDHPTAISGDTIDESGPDDNGLVTAPMRSLQTLTQTTVVQPTRHIQAGSPEASDFIAHGSLSITEADYLFSQYRSRLNTLLWAGILCPHADLERARHSSTLLTAAVLTVAALHTPGHAGSLEICYEILIDLVKQASMSRSQSLDDIRGLCIAAFYINALSWRLCGLAIRIATEMGLHMAFRNLIRGQPDARELVRLWYALYICDHQYSIAHGRPPIMFNDAAVRGIDRFLAGGDTTDGDIRLSAQLSLWPILTEAYVLYGTDPDLELTDSDYEKLRSFSIAVDQWRTSWRLRSADMPIYGAYPSKGVVLYYHFALFQLNSLALRGISTTPGQNASGLNLSWDRRESANVAINSARSTLRLIIEEQDLRSALVGVPIFTHTMIAMSATFLLKLAVAFGSNDTTTSIKTRLIVPKDLSTLGLTFSTASILSLVTNLTAVLDETTKQVSAMHLISHINSGLKALLSRFSSPNADGDYRYLLPIGAEDIRHGPQSDPAPPSYDPQASDAELPDGAANTAPLETLQPSYTAGGDLGPLIGGMFEWKFDEDFLWPSNNDGDNWLTDQ